MRGTNGEERRSEPEQEKNPAIRAVCNANGEFDIHVPTTSSDIWGSGGLLGQREWKRAKKREGFDEDPTTIFCPLLVLSLDIRGDLT